MEIYYNRFDGEINEKIQARKLLARIFLLKNIDINECEFEKSAHGKPFVKNLGFDFNISHTKNFVTVVVGKNVGIDCQKIIEVKDSVIKKVCSDSEMNIIKNSSNPNLEFIRFWTFKEAYTKMLGCGFRYNFKNVNVENAFCLHNDIKIFQKKFDNIHICAIEEKSEGKVELLEIEDLA